MSRERKIVGLLALCGLVLMTVYICIFWGLPPLCMPKPAATPVAAVPKPITTHTDITVADWWWEEGGCPPSHACGGPVPVALFPNGCACGEPREDGRMCAVYVNILSDLLSRVWSDASPEELESVVGVTWVSNGILERDPRYEWQSIVDGICALAEEAIAHDDPLLFIESVYTTGPVCQDGGGSRHNVYFACCEDFIDDYEWDVIGYSAFCP